MPFYRGERITFDVAPSRLDFTVEHDSLRIEVRPPSALYKCLGSQPRAQMLQTCPHQRLFRMAIGGSGTLCVAWGTIDIVPLTQHLHLAELARALVRAALSVRCLEFCSTSAVQ